MTEPRTPDDQPIEPSIDPAAAEAHPAPSADSPTQAWPSLAGPPSGAERTPAVAAAAAPVVPSPSVAPSSDSLYEPAESLPATRVGAVVGSGPATDAPRGRSRLRWGLALVGVLIVAAGSALIVSLVGGRPTTSVAMGYMPATTVNYSEVRLDLPGDQRQKLATFLQAFPGFADQSAIEPKIDEVFDKIVRAASKDQQTWTADIKPWFGGQVAVGAGVPTDPTSTDAMSAAGDSLFAVTITDRSKAIAWLTKTATQSGNPALDRSTYAGADLFVGAGAAVAVNDQVLLGGPTASVKAALDSAGKGGFAQNDDVKAALASLDKDYVAFSVTRTRAYADAMVAAVEKMQPGALGKTQLDETVLAMVPAWQSMTARFENDAIVTSSVGPSWAIGYDGANRASQLVGHAPANSLVYLDTHDAGPALTAVLAKFRALPEAKDAFAQLDQALSVLGGSDAVFGWWGDTAVVAAPAADGTIGAGLVIHPRDAAAAERLFTTVNGFLALAGSNAGVAVRTEDHNGTKITIVDLSGLPGMEASSLPPGYKAEIAWASNADVAVIGYGSAFVQSVLDAGPGKSLADNARFKALLDRVGAENLGVAFVDIAGIRALVEPLAQAQMPAEAWDHYVKEIQPYLKPIDALISNVRKDGNLSRSTGALTAH